MGIAWGEGGLRGGMRPEHHQNGIHPHTHAASLPDAERSRPLPCTALLRPVLLISPRHRTALCCTSNLRGGAKPGYTPPPHASLHSAVQHGAACSNRVPGRSLIRLFTLKARGVPPHFWEEGILTTSPSSPSTRLHTTWRGFWALRATTTSPAAALWQEHSSVLEGLALGRGGI